MTQNLSALSGLCKHILDETRKGPLLTHTITDINEPQSSGEVDIAVLTSLSGAGLGSIQLFRAHFAIGAFRVHQAAMEVLKRLFPLRTTNYAPSLTLVNVAQIADAHEGRRKDRVWVATTESGRIALGYAAENSPILDRILPGLSGLWEFQTPPEWDKGLHFRTRDVLARLAGPLLAQKAEVLSFLRPVHLKDAREHFGVIPFDANQAWWPDEIGLKPFNIKTGIDTSHPLVRVLKPKDRVEITFDGGATHWATYAHCLQDGIKGSLVLAHASSGFELPGEEPVHFLDLMLYGGNAFEHLGEPGETATLQIRKVVLHREHATTVC